MNKPKARLKAMLSILFMAAFAITIFINGCQEATNELKTLRVGLSRWPGYDVVIYGQEKGLFEKRGLNVELVLFDVPPDAPRAMVQGRLDAVYVPLGDLIQADSDEKTLSYVMVTNISYGGDGIVTQKQYSSIKELRGKSVGAKLGTTNHLVLLEALKSQGIKPDEVKIQDIPNDIAQQQMKEGSLDAAVLWEPLLSSTAQEINGNIIFTTKDVDSLVIDGLASRSSFIADHSEELTKFIVAWFDIMHAVENNPDEVFEVVSKKLNQKKEDFASDYAGLKKGDINLNQRMFEEGRLFQAKKQLSQLLKEDPRHSRQIQEEIDINSELVTAAIKKWKPLN